MFNIQRWLKWVAQGQNDSIMTEMKPRSKGCQSFGYCGHAQDFQMSFWALGTPTEIKVLQKTADHESPKEQS